MEVAKVLVRTIVRGFYTTEYILIIDALAIHSTLTDADLAHVLGMQTKALRRLCGKLKEDGLVSVQSRGEKKEGAPSYASHSTSNGVPQVKERLYFRDWYYINFHRAIDSIKYRLWKLNRHIESQGAPTTEKKDLICPRCKSTYTELEVMDNIGDEGFYCHRCGNLLESTDDHDAAAAAGPENESMKRMNDQLAKVLALMRQIDAADVPENDFDMALRHHLPVDRPDTNPGAKVTVVDYDRDHKGLLIASSKGLAMAPEKVSVNLTEARVDADAPSADAKRAKEAKQNSLPEWISRSTLTGEITTVGAKEAADRRVREADYGDGAVGTPDPADEERKRDVVDSAVMDEYWKELQAAQERERREEREADEDDEDEDEDEDGFEDVAGLKTEAVAEGAPPAKKQKVHGDEAGIGAKGEDSDADDDDDDELQFEDV